MNIDDLDGQAGTYLLILRLADSQTLAVGRLGTVAFAAGWYAYAGSAFGSGGLRGRLRHHRTPARRPHWHVDYLRQAARLDEIWCVRGERLEHAWAATLAALPGAQVPVPRFGASDCRCAAHLIWFAEPPDFSRFQMAAASGAAAFRLHLSP